MRNAMFSPAAAFGTSYQLRGGVRSSSDRELRPSRFAGWSDRARPPNP